MKNNSGLRYFLYARKSSESEDRQMASIEDQKAEVSKISDELGLNVVEVFSESKSAKAPGRTVFNEMLLRIEKGEADAILCWKLNRLARNPVDGGKISWMLQNNIIKHIQCFGRDYKPSDNVLMMQVELGMANQFVKDLSVDVKRGMRQKAERGWCPFPTLPIGYIHHKNRKGVVQNQEIIEDPERHPIVKKLWNLMLTGAYSIAEIKREGDKRGLVNFNKRSYCIHTYHKLFSTEFFFGYFYWNDVNGNKKRYRGLHTPMVSQQEYEKVQIHIGNHKRPTRKKKYDFSFRGLLTCGECGCSITAERKLQVRCTKCRYKFSCINRDDCPKCNFVISEMKKPTVIDITYYRCTKKKGSCSQKTIQESELEKQYLKALQSIEIEKPFYDFITKELKDYDETNNAVQLQYISQIKKRKSEIESRINGLTLMRAEGDISKEMYHQLKEQSVKEAKTLESEIKQEERGITNWMEVAIDYLNFSLNASKTLEESDYFTKKALLSKIGSNQTLLDRKLYFIKAKPLLALKECDLVYRAEKQGLEPKNHLINKGDSHGFDTPNVSLCTGLHNVRTSIIDS
ncbi:recombinase family protein [uncultured Dokdonia sp.]|uniref:recombinase family protein n=1 Tax=uncultured Dokdonia sp. TaxID=575653 RepID=UPI00262287C2|nr:recombinase family protein [uncultured Dokdonia sp.]